MAARVAWPGARYGSWLALLALALLVSSAGALRALADEASAVTPNEGRIAAAGTVAIAGGSDAAGVAEVLVAAEGPDLPFEVDGPVAAAAAAEEAEAAAAIAAGGKGSIGSGESRKREVGEEGGEGASGGQASDRIAQAAERYRSVEVSGTPHAEEAVRAMVSSQAAPSEGQYRRFFDDSSACADQPVPSLLFRSKRFKSGQGARLPTLTVHRVWHTRHPRALDDVTLCTNSGRDRLHMLEGQCTSWGGPLSATVYVELELLNPRNEEILRETIAEVDALHARMEAAVAGPSDAWGEAAGGDGAVPGAPPSSSPPTGSSRGGCAADIVLVSELLPKGRTWAYPYNAVRNQALARARTRMVLLLDVDFVVSAGAREKLLEPLRWQQIVHNAEVERDVFVLPAFETDSSLPRPEGERVAGRAAGGGKRALRGLFDSGAVVRFAPFYRRGHGSTDYARWFRARAPYVVPLVPGYEPFLLASRLRAPWYDERFRGYGMDKITHTYVLAKTGHALTVLPDVWLVHRPHAPSAGYNASFTGPAYTRGHKPTANMQLMDRIGKEVFADVDAGVYPTRGVTALAGCRRLEAFFDGPDGAGEHSLSEELAAAATKDERARIVEGRIDQPVVTWW